MKHLPSAWRRKQQPTPVFLPGEFRGQRSLVGTVCGVAERRTRLSGWAHSIKKGLKEEVMLEDLEEIWEGLSDCPMVRTSRFHSRSQGLIPGWGIKISQAAWPSQKKKREKERCESQTEEADVWGRLLLSEESVRSVQRPSKAWDCLARLRSRRESIANLRCVISLHTEPSKQDPKVWAEMSIYEELPNKPANSGASPQPPCSQPAVFNPRVHELGREKKLHLFFFFSTNLLLEFSTSFNYECRQHTA